MPLQQSCSTDLFLETDSPFLEVVFTISTATSSNMGFKGAKNMPMSKRVSNALRDGSFSIPDRLIKPLDLRSPICYKRRSKAFSIWSLETTRRSDAKIDALKKKRLSKKQGLAQMSPSPVRTKPLSLAQPVLWHELLNPCPTTLAGETHLANWVLSQSILGRASEPYIVAWPLYRTTAPSPRNSSR